MGLTYGQKGAIKGFRLSSKFPRLLIDQNSQRLVLGELKFNSAQEWLPYSCDLYTLYYSLWSILEARACPKPHNTLKSLTRSFIRVWKLISTGQLWQITENFAKHLRLFIQANRLHFQEMCFFSFFLTCCC